MEWLIGAVIGGTVLAAVLWVTIYRVVGGAADNLFTWLIETFGNRRQ